MDATAPSEPPRPSGAIPLEPADAALVEAVATADDTVARFDLAGLAAEVATSTTLLEAVARAGLLLPHHVDDDGVARYTAADADAVRAGLTLLDAGLPLAELLALAGPTDAAVADIADRAVDAFLRFVRDPVLGTIGDGEEAGVRLVAAYAQMLPATERLVAHHLRRRLIAAALARLAESDSRSDDRSDSGSDSRSDDANDPTSDPRATPAADTASSGA